MDTTEVIRRVREYLGDQAEEFRTSRVSDGLFTWYNLPKVNVFNVDVSAISGSVITDLIAGTDYELDSVNGIVMLTVPVTAGEVLLVQGSAYALMTDENIEDYIDDALAQHTNGRTVSERYSDSHGFIKYRETEITLDNLPPVEEALVVILTALQIFWALSSDASTEIDIHTAEGTNLPFGQRWQQIHGQIEFLDNLYKDMAAQLNVGLFRVEVLNLRKRSWRTGRFTPIFTTREYDDYTPPKRVLPPIESRDEDESGVPNPFRGNYGGY